MITPLFESSKFVSDTDILTGTYYLVPFTFGDKGDLSRTVPNIGRISTQFTTRVFRISVKTTLDDSRETVSRSGKNMDVRGAMYNLLKILHISYLVSESFTSFHFILNIKSLSYTPTREEF